MVFFVPSNNNKASNVAINGATVSTYPVPTDTMVNYQGCNPCTDLRSTVYDSYRMNMTSWYIDAGDGRRYESNDPPIGNVAYTTYLRSKDALQTAMNRYVDGINFPEWTMNRSFIFVPFNVAADPALAITSSQVVLNMQLDLSDRVQNSQYYQESNLSCTNQWSAFTFAITV